MAGCGVYVCFGMSQPLFMKLLASGRDGIVDLRLTAKTLDTAAEGREMLRGIESEARAGVEGLKMWRRRGHQTAMINTPSRHRSLKPRTGPIRQVGLSRINNSPASPTTRHMREIWRDAYVGVLLDNPSRSF
ncbi:hypothetical protein K470DRAFT_263933 [Piedraia hortae CBS 480.64]|uniref:Uncharacterized protein n=1 Tax=Piedraia hortae CBS 480.64 TaxID=1314780 RepID=A0A6A7C257_9PEZI|nr:hypothetical protein K470DRAFT_263933 [Piedraia hortae CBS 480.64]